MAQGSNKVGATSQNTHHRQRQDILIEKRRQTVNICDELVQIYAYGIIYGKVPYLGPRT
jgi:hypothetical protein